MLGHLGQAHRTNNITYYSVLYVLLLILLDIHAYFIHRGWLLGRLRHYFELIENRFHFYSNIFPKKQIYMVNSLIKFILFICIFFIINTKKNYNIIQVLHKLIYFVS
jgi:hypothetical protein